MHRFRFNLSVFHQFAVEGIGAAGAKGIAPTAGRDDTDPDWQPM
ncbi:hypothetical protein [Rhodanobacter panaciterrae]|nr:hypothetical protein [Rhodanobacter panaciterrae]